MSLNRVFVRMKQPVSNAPSIQDVKPVRKEKVHAVKFPVTKELRQAFREYAAKANGKKGKYKTVETNTALLTKRLKFGYEKLPYLILQSYHDTGVYMHVRPTESQYAQIERIAFNNGVSIRKAVYCIMVHALEGELINAKRS